MLQANRQRPQVFLKPGLDHRPAVGQGLNFHSLAETPQSGASGDERRRPVTPSII